MYEFHGWATIRDTYECIDNEGEHIEEIINTLKSHIGEFGMFNWNFDIKLFNGEYHLTASGFTNHSHTAELEVLELFRLVAKNAPGSYGILYIHDDEDPNGHDNEFKVYVLKRGELKMGLDTFLSPCIPKIEDEYKER